MTTLLMSARHSEDDQALWRAAIDRGWAVVRARGIRLPEIDDEEIIIYVEALYGPTIARMIGRELLEPSDDWLPKVPLEFRKREIRLVTLKTARSFVGSIFAKPPNDKSFPAEVYESGQELPEGFDDEMPVLVADPIPWTSEYRCFCLDGRVLTLSPYLRSGVHAKTTEYSATEHELLEAKQFAENVLEAVQGFTPRAIVIDVGQVPDRGWAVVEANGAWGSGIYGCHPMLVLDVLRHATIPRLMR